MLARGSFRQGDKPKLKNIPYAELCGRYAVFLRRFGNSGAFQRLTVRDGRICLYGNAVFRAERYKLFRRISDMSKHLIYRRLYPAMREQTFKVIAKKV